MPFYPFAPALRTVSRSMDAAHFNAIANHDAVRPTLGGDGPMELRPVIENARNYAFATPHGGFLLLDCGSGRYDVHSLFLPEGRGREAMDAMREVAAYMFTHTDCTEGLTTVPEGHVGALALATRGGFEQTHVLDHFPWRTDATVKASCLSLTLQRWALTSTATLAAGRWFHEVLEHAKIAARSARPVHADEPAHDRFAGAAVLLARGGQVDKAVAFYNMQALRMRYATIALLSKKPATIDVGDAVVEATEDGMAVLLCR